MAKKDKSSGELEPQKSSAAQFITYIASTEQSSEKYELRYEDENIWMSQKTLAAVYGVEVPNIAYHLKKLYDDAEVDQVSTIKEQAPVAFGQVCPNGTKRFHDFTHTPRHVFSGLYPAKPDFIPTSLRVHTPLL